jgi:hypothetical protein
MEYQWVLFCPQLPSTPSSPRVTLWRKMRSAGAIGLDNGLWLLPWNDHSITLVKEMEAYVQGQGGVCRNFLADSLDPSTQCEILERFRQDRDEEYSEMKEQCADFIKEIEKEIARKNYSFAELEENEQDLEKLEVWFRKIQGRDFMGGSQADESLEWLEKCRSTLQTFAEQVFYEEASDHTQKMKFDPGKPSAT